MPSKNKSKAADNCPIFGCLCPLWAQKQTNRAGLKSDFVRYRPEAEMSQRRDCTMFKSEHYAAEFNHALSNF